MSCIPFLTCLFWFIQYAINYKKKDLAKRMYMWLLATCVVLYFCHYLFLEQLIGDTPFERHDEGIDEKGQSDIGLKIENLKTEEQLYLTNKLKINDVSKRLGLCRTYVSNYINQTHDCNFSDYINKLRVEHAKNYCRHPATPST